MADKLRMCLVCRKSAPKESLLRFVAQGRSLVLDQAHVLQGRGAYIHPSAECARRMAIIPKWEKALSLDVGTLDVTVVQDLAREVIHRVVREVVPGEEITVKSSKGDAARKRLRL